MLTSCNKECDKNCSKDSKKECHKNKEGKECSKDSKKECHKNKEGKDSATNNDAENKVASIQRSTIIKFRGMDVHTNGVLPTVGSKADDFELIASEDGKKVKLSDYQGKKVILNIFPKIDSKVCAASVRAFNEKVAELDNTVVLCVSNDDIKDMKAFCAAEGIKNVEVLSNKDQEFGKLYGVELTDEKLKNLLSRAVVYIDEIGTVRYTEQVPEITQEPNYDKALEAVKHIKDLK